jgi:phosphate transport system protein
MSVSAQRTTSAARDRRRKPRAAAHPLTDLALRGCLVAIDASANVQEFLDNSAHMAYLAIKDCEKELDRMERQIDEELPSAITEVTEPEARELLACLKFITDLERIGDLVWWVAQHVQLLQLKLAKRDREQLIGMAAIVHKMLQQVQEGFAERDFDRARSVLQVDSEIDQIYRSLFRRHFEHTPEKHIQRSTDVLLMAQALERAGDHAKNLAEELYHLVEGHSMRHLPKKRLRD